MPSQTIRPIDDGIELEVEIDGTTRTLRFREDSDGDLNIALVQSDGTEVAYGEPVGRGSISDATKTEIQNARDAGDVQTQIDHILDILDIINLE